MYCIQHFVEPCDMYGYLLFRICNDHLNQRLFHSYVVSSFSFFHLVFLIVLLRHFLWFFCFHFANSTKFLGSSWERLLGHVCHATDKQADALGNIYICINYLYWTPAHTLRVLPLRLKRCYICSQISKWREKSMFFSVLLSVQKRSN